MTFSELAAALREAAVKVRNALDPVPLGPIASELEDLADEAISIDAAHAEAIDAARQEKDDAVAEARGDAAAAEDARDDAAAAEEARDDAIARAEDLEQSLSDIVEAAVAAREGRPGAAQAVIDLIVRRHPEVGQHLPGMTGAARSRPHDYWTYG